MSLRVGAAVQIEGRVIGDRAFVAQARGSQETVDRPGRGVGMLGHRGEDATGDALDVAGLEVVGEHRRDDPILGAATDRRGIFSTAEDRVGAEERRRDELGHGRSGQLFNIIVDNYNFIMVSTVNNKVYRISCQRAFL